MRVVLVVTVAVALGCTSPAAAPSPSPPIVSTATPPPVDAAPGSPGAPIRPRPPSFDFRKAALDPASFVGTTQACDVISATRTSATRFQVHCYDGVVATAIDVDVEGKVAIAERQLLTVKITAGGSASGVAATTRLVEIGPLRPVPEPDPRDRCACIDPEPAPVADPRERGFDFDRVKTSTKLWTTTQLCVVGGVWDLARIDPAAESYTLPGQMPPAAGTYVARMQCLHHGGSSELIVAFDNLDGVLLAREGAILKVALYWTGHPSSPTAVWRSYVEVPSANHEW